MLIVECEIEETLVEVSGRSVSGVMATCSRCGHCVELPGRDSAMLRRRLLDLLHSTCPESEKNRYRPLAVFVDLGAMQMSNGED